MRSASNASRPASTASIMARAIAPECKHEIVGVRPGEKIHEVLISEDEGRNTVEYNECYVVRQNPAPDLMEPCETNGGCPCPEGFSYVSNSNPWTISVEDLRAIVEQIADDYSIEQTRWSMEDVPQ